MNRCLVCTHNTNGGPTKEYCSVQCLVEQRQTNAKGSNFNNYIKPDVSPMQKETRVKSKN
jgi:hypothetical protein